MNSTHADSVPCKTTSKLPFVIRPYPNPFPLLKSDPLICVFRFTAAVRTTFNFNGTEMFAFSGGEELWVYIDKKLVVQIFTDPTSANSPCRTVSLAGAGKLYSSLQ